MSTFTVGSAPHIRAQDDIPRIMWDVAVALIPALVAAGYFFGWYAILLVAVSVATAVLTEGVIQKLRRVPVAVSDGSAVVTGMLLAFVIPANAPLYVPIVGSFFGVAIVKQCFGGLGCNIWNPALGGRAFLHFAFPEAFNAGAWAILGTGRRVIGAVHGADAVTHATPLKVVKKVAETAVENQPQSAEWWQRVLGGEGAIEVPATGEMLGRLKTMLFEGQTITVEGEPLQLVSPVRLFLGDVPGCIGEISAVALILGGVYLLVRRRITWHVPVCYIATVFVLTMTLPMAMGWPWLPGPQAGLYHILAGGLMLGAIYMATDMVTSPITVKGQVIFAVGCGVLTALIRLFGGYPEGVAFSILLMNTAVPLIDRYTQPRVFGVT